MDTLTEFVTNGGQIKNVMMAHSHQKEYSADHEHIQIVMIVIKNI